MLEASSEARASSLRELSEFTAVRPVIAIASTNDPEFRPRAISAAYFTAQTHDVRATLWTIGSLILIYLTCWPLLVALGI